MRLFINRLALSASLAAAVFAAANSAARADLIELSDGRKISGTLARQGDVMVIKGDDGKTLSVDPKDVAKVTLSGGITPEDAAKDEWNRISVQIKKADDLPTVISLHENFLKKYPNMPMSKQVEDALGAYRKLSDAGSAAGPGGGAVKFRGQWMLRGQIEITLKRWNDDARPALDHYRAGRFKEALDSVKSILAADDQNPDALTLGGLAAYRLNNLSQAKTYFTALAAADPASVIAENNLAVVCAQQKQPGEGLVHYSRALQAAPDNRLLLDNIVEALNAYPGDKALINYRTLVRQFEPAEQALETALAKKNLYRWGSTWVSKEQLDTLNSRRTAVQAQAASLDSQYRTTLQTLSGLESQLKDLQSIIDARVNDINFIDAQLLIQRRQGLDTVLLLNQREADNQQLQQALQQRDSVQRQRTDAAAQLGDMRAQAESITAAMGPQTQFTGMQRIMDLGEDLTPPAPVAVVIAPDPPPAPPAPQVIVIQQPAPPAPLPQTIYVPVPVYITPGGGNPGGRGGRGNGPGNGGNGRGNRGGRGNDTPIGAPLDPNPLPPTTGPTTIPTTRPTTRPRPLPPVTPTPNPPPLPPSTRPTPQTIINPPGNRPTTRPMGPTTMQQ